MSHPSRTAEVQTPSVLSDRALRVAGEDAQASASRFPNVYCSNCGGEFGPGDAGFSHCDDHAGLRNLDDDIHDNELPGMWESADFMGGQVEVRGPDWKPTPVTRVPHLSLCASQDDTMRGYPVCDCGGDYENATLAAGEPSAVTPATQSETK